MTKSKLSPAEIAKALGASGWKYIGDRKPTHTCWYHVTDKGLEFTHLANGYDPDAEMPTPMSKEQEKSFHHGLWYGVPAHMEGLEVIEHCVAGT